MHTNFPEIILYVGKLNILPIDKIFYTRQRRFLLELHARTRLGSRSKRFHPQRQDHYDSWNEEQYCRPGK